MSDFITREKVIETFIDWQFKEFGYADLNRGERFIDAIESIPAAAPKMGKWVEVTNGRGGHECSECHEYAPSYQDGREHLTDYCPECGVKMERSE